MEVQETQVQTDRVFTIPNALSFLRLLAVPLFMWLALGPEADVAALVVLMLSGVTDYLDGKLARAWGQISKVGQLLDPLADRLTIIAVVVTLGLREIVPWWIVALLLARDLMLACVVPLLLRRGRIAVPVHFLGKAATFNLLYAFPLLLLSDLDNAVGTIAEVFGWALVCWGIGLYWWSAIIYLVDIRALLKADRP